MFWLVKALAAHVRTIAVASILAGVALGAGAVENSAPRVAAQECFVTPRIDIVEGMGFTEQPRREPPPSLAPLAPNSAVQGTVFIGPSSNPSNIFAIRLYGKFDCAFTGAYEFLVDSVVVQAAAEDQSTIKLMTDPQQMAQFLAGTPRAATIGARLVGGSIATTAKFNILRPSADVTCSNGVTADDVLFEMEVITGLRNPTNCHPDVNKDGQVTVADALHIKLFLLGMVHPYASNVQNTGGK